MPRRRKEKKVTQKANLYVIEITIKNVIQGYLSVWVESVLYKFSFSTLIGRVTDVKYTATGLNPCFGDTIGHPTEFIKENESYYKRETSWTKRSNINAYLGKALCI